MTKAVDGQSLREQLEVYTKKGIYVFPVSYQTKRPAIEDNLNQASNNIDVLMKWAEKFPGCNWAMSCAKSGFVVVDIDKAGLEAWGKLDKEFGTPTTLKQNSGSGVGFHYVFKAEAGKRYRGKISKGIDVKHNGYILIPPSIHPSTGNPYVWANNLVPTLLPQWLKDRTEKPTDVVRQKTDNVRTGLEFYRKIIAQMRDKPFGYEEWVKAGMALHAATDGSEEGLELFYDLTEGVNYNEGDIEKAKEKWQGFKPGGVNAGSLVYLARDLGCEIQNMHFESDLQDFPIIEDVAPTLVETEVSTSKDTPVEGEWITDYKGRSITEDAEFLVDFMNREGLAILVGEQSGQVVQTYFDEWGIPQVKLLSGERLKNTHKNMFFREWIKPANGGPKKPKLTAAIEMWLQSSHRKKFSDIIFRSTGPKEALNLWSPIPCKQVDGPIDDFMWLIYEVISAGQKAKGDYLLDYLAHICQKPEEKTAIVPVLIGEQGTGKGLLMNGILKGIFKSYHLLIDSIDQLTARFNAKQARRLIINCDEALWQGDHTSANKVKSRTGNKTLTIEEKFGGVYTIDDYARIFITTNNSNAVKIEPGNRRFLTFEVSGKYLKNAAYGRMWDAIKNDLCERVFKFLMTRDISKFNPHIFPAAIDTGGTDTKIESMSPVGQFWVEKIFTNPSPIFFSALNCSTTYIYLDKHFVFQEFIAWSKEVNHWKRGITQTHFWRETNMLAPAIVGRNAKRRLVEKDRRIILIDPKDFIKEFTERNKLQFSDLPCELDLIQFNAEKIKEHDIQTPTQEFENLDL